MNRTDVEDAYRLHKDAVYRFAWRMCSSPEMADDITQEVFLRLMRGEVRFDPSRGTLRTLLLGVARNVTLNTTRHLARWEPLDDEEFVAPPCDLDGTDVAGIVGRAVQALPGLQREVLILFEYDELSLEDIAHTVEANVGTVKSRLFRARENLRRMLAPLRADNHTLK